jgi:sec-independent protein translocase protein TatC
MTQNVSHTKPDDKQPEKTEDGDIRMTFTEHLGELRTRIMVSGAAVVISFIICYAFSEQVYEVVSRPLQPDPVEITTTEPGTGDGTEAEQGPQIKWVQLNFIEWFMVKLKLAAYGGLLLASPIIAYQICSFIFPGLKPKERRVVRVALSGCVALGAVGASVAYFFVFPIVLQYLIQLVPAEVETNLRMSENVALLIKGYMAFAIAFQFPLVVLVLVYLDLLSPATLREYRKYSIVGIAFMSALFTPPEPISMIIMMVPLYLLYEMSIWASYLVVRRRSTGHKSD